MEEHKELDILKYSLDPIAFITEILGLDCEWFHREWIDLFEKNEYVSLLAPRGHGKSWMVGAYLVWKIVNNPDIRILTVTINQGKANEMMSFIQHHLEHNERLIEIFGSQKGYTDWSRSTLRVYRAGRSGIANKEPTFTVFGVTAGMVGGHYEVIVLDDITDRENSRLDHRRKELQLWYNQTVTPMVEPGSQVISIGTKWHEVDIHHYFRQLSNFVSKTYKAIIDTESDPPKVLWPSRWSYEELMKRKAGMGSLGFEMQYQNEIISSEDSPIKREWVEAAMDKYKIIPQPFKTYIGVDFSSKGDDSDYFSITVVGVNEASVYVLDGIKTKATMFKQFDLIKSYYRKWNAIKIGVESVGPQKMVVDQLIIEHPTLPIFPIKSSSINYKMSRVQALSVLFETGRVFLNPSMTDWADEMIYFPRGAHDDTVDSLAFAVQASQVEEDKHVNWKDVATMISTRKSEPKPNVKRGYTITKI